MKVIISGGGIAGLTLALCLHRAGHEAMIVERAPAPRGGGYMIDFFSSGYDAAEKLGLLDALAQVHYPIAALVGVDRRGNTRSRIRYRDLRRQLDDRHFNFMRGELEQVLYDQLAGQVPIRFATEVAAIEEDAAGVSVSFSDGSHATCDLLVGADGIHSRIRELCFGPERDCYRYLGMRTAAYLMPRPDHPGLPADVFAMLTLVGRLVAVYPIRGDRLATFFLYAAASPLADQPAPSPCEELRSTFGDLGWLVPDVLKGCGEAGRPYLDDVAQIELPTWYRGRVALVGDACQAVSLVAGQGASLAMAGAYLLAEALGQGPTIEEALARYEARMRPFATRQQAAGRGFAPWFLPDSRWRLGIREALFWAASLPGGARLLKGELAVPSIFAAGAAS